MTDFTPPRRLTAEDDADGFDCGLPVVNDWLRNQLRNAGKQHTAVAYATFCDGAPAGFYTLGAYSIGHAEANGWLRRNSPDPIPAILLGMLGVAMRYQTMHVGGTAAQGRHHAGDGCGGDSRSQGVARGAGLGQGHALLRALRVPPHRAIGQDVHPSPFGVNGMPVEEGGGRAVDGSPRLLVFSRIVFVGPPFISLAGALCRPSRIGRAVRWRCRCWPGPR